MGGGDARQSTMALCNRMRVVLATALGALFLVPTVVLAASSAPNIVVVLADDLDQTLGSAGLALNKTREIIGENGAKAKNWFAHTPICCPSRAEILTGRYFHNLRTASPKDPGCMHINVSRNASASEFYSKFYFATHFQKLGYTVGIFGKHLNSANSAKAPPGVDRWFVNGGGNYFNPTFTEPSGRGGEVTFDNCTTTEGGCYSTTVIGNVSRSWIWDHVRRSHVDGGPLKPFMAYISVKAPHIQDGPGWPVTLPAPAYKHSFDGIRAPRTPNWNATGLDQHHWLVRTQPGMSAEQLSHSDELYRARLRSLLSLDDLVEDLVTDLTTLDVLDSTIIMFTSDHGFQMGQFGMPEGKWNSYEHDIRVPMLVRGPGIPPGHVFDVPATHVDLMPTLLSFAGALAVPATMDGKSLSAYIRNREVDMSAVRTDILLEYAGGNVVRYQALEDSTNNTFRALRVLDPRNNQATQRDLMYAEYTNLEDWDFTLPPLETELFDLSSDPFQMRNIVKNADPELLSDLRERLRRASTCRGAKQCP